MNDNSGMMNVIQVANTNLEKTKSESTVDQWLFICLIQKDNMMLRPMPVVGGPNYHLWPTMTKKKRKLARIQLMSASEQKEQLYYLADELDNNETKII